jgi:hypothetical protein
MVDGAGACAGLRTALRDGLGFGSSGRGMTVVVPDGIRFIRAHVPCQPRS